MHKNFKDLTGKKFGMLTVLELTDDYVQPNGRRRYRYLCQCDCGNVCKVVGEQMTTGHVRSCGCARKLAAQNREHSHPYVGTRIYRVWGNMVNRCTNPKNPAYDRYGGRGVTVCDEWKNSFMSFYTWAMENGYAEDLTIDRIDNNGGYSPENCRWTDNFTQANNKSNNHIVEFNGSSMTIAEWANEIDVDYKVLHRRFQLGWSTERALTQPVRKSGRSNTNDGKKPDRR